MLRHLRLTKKIALVLVFYHAHQNIYIKTVKVKLIVLNPSTIHFEVYTLKLSLQFIWNIHELFEFHRVIKKYFGYPPPRKKHKIRHWFWIMSNLKQIMKGMREKRLSTYSNDNRANGPFSSDLTLVSKINVENNELDSSIY